MTRDRHLHPEGSSTTPEASPCDAETKDEATIADDSVAAPAREGAGGGAPIAASSLQQAIWEASKAANVGYTRLPESVATEVARILSTPPADTEPPPASCSLCEGKGFVEDETPTGIRESECPDCDGPGLAAPPADTSTGGGAYCGHEFTIRECRKCGTRIDDSMIAPPADTSRAREIAEEFKRS